MEQGNCWAGGWGSADRPKPDYPDYRWRSMEDGVGELLGWHEKTSTRATTTTGKMRRGGEKFRRQITASRLHPHSFLAILIYQSLVD